MTSRQDETTERPASLAARSRVGVVDLARSVPIRWRILSIAALNSLVVLVLAGMIWSGSQVLGSAWDDVRQVREVGQDPGAAGERNRPPAEPDPPVGMTERPVFDPAGKSQEEELSARYGLPKVNKDGSGQSNYND